MNRQSIVYQSILGTRSSVLVLGTEDPVLLLVQYRSTRHAAFYRIFDSFHLPQLQLYTSLFALLPSPYIPSHLSLSPPYHPYYIPSMAVDCIPMASRHHPHHPSNYTYNKNYTYAYTPSVRRSSSTNSSNSSNSFNSNCTSHFSSNNPYARLTTSSPHNTTSYNRRSIPISLTDWSPDTHHQAERERKRNSTSSIPRRKTHRYPRTSQLVNPDIIDQLDDVTNYSYHHEGPYDAVYPERNRISQRSPLEAVRESNEEALRATPRDKITDCLNSHRPLDGVAFFSPGETDRNGQTYSYEEGSNMMNDFGNFMRTPGQVWFFSRDILSFVSDPRANFFFKEIHRRRLQK